MHFSTYLISHFLGICKLRSWYNFYLTSALQQIHFSTYSSFFVSATDVTHEKKVFDVNYLIGKTHSKIIFFKSGRVLKALFVLKISGETYRYFWNFVNTGRNYKGRLTHITRACQKVIFILR